MGFAKLAMFKVTFLSIILEALPFILLGSFISSMINEYVSEKTIQRIIPSNRVLAVLSASLAGLLFPVCECAIVPIVRRLLKKGMPLHVAIPFLVSVPIINPVVLFSTYIAFHGMGSVVLLRAGMGLIVAWSLGAIFIFSKKNTREVLLENGTVAVCGCGHDHGHSEIKRLPLLTKDRVLKTSNTGLKTGKMLSVKPAVSIKKVKKKRKSFPWKSILAHTSSEFFEVGRLLIFGAILSSVFKALVPRVWIVAMGQNLILSIFIMMIVAFILSLCSEADAFIARTFMGTFPTSAVMAFLVLGPMIDIKNYIMLSGTFEKRFVIRLTGLIFALVFAVCLVVGLA